MPTDDEVVAMKNKLQAISYQAKRQDPKRFFAQYDKDKSGSLDLGEFIAAVRKGGRMPPATISDRDLKTLFGVVDSDRSGDMSIDELTAFVWGSLDGAAAATSSSGAARERQRSMAAAGEVRSAAAANVAAEGTGPTAYEIRAMKKKLQALSYGGVEGADPARRVLEQYDRDQTGSLDLLEFTAAVRKGGKVAASVISDEDLKALFGVVGGDKSGDMSIDNLTEFVWGTAGDIDVDIDTAAAPGDADDRCGDFH